MARKIIQIAVCGVERTQFTQCSIVTVALCDDGTVWHLYNEHEGWHQQPNVPQEIVEEKIEQTNNSAIVEICPSCNGEKAVPSSINPDCYVACPACSGSGKLHQ